MAPWLIWFLLALALAFLEMAMPGLILIFFSIGSLVTSAVLLLFDPSFTQQILIFLLSSMASLLLLRRWMSRVFRGDSSSRQRDNFDDSPVGIRVPVIKAISPAERGRIRYRGSDWYATAGECIEADAIVEIVGYADSSRQVYCVKSVTSIQG
ncbi:MAG: NfeD family protein [Gemmatimonadetes bacterium]|nr:NfeD family protein [Gemmatimonadota bacterium]